jgi:hypothetical protein
MKTPPRLLFGVRTAGTVSLTITASGQLPPQVPALRICTSGQDVTIPCSNSTWVATLKAGDHVVHLPAPNDASLDGPLTFTLSPPATIIAAANQSGAPLVSWTAAIGASSDPKNPLPPPAINSLDAALLADSTWLCSTLSAHDMKAVIERSA